MPFLDISYEWTLPIKKKITARVLGGQGLASAGGVRVGVGTEETRFLVRISLRLWQDTRKGVTDSYSWVDSALLFLSARAYHTPSLLNRV